MDCGLVSLYTALLVYHFPSSQDYPSPADRSALSGRPVHIGASRVWGLVVVQGIGWNMSHLPLSSARVIVHSNYNAHCMKPWHCCCHFKARDSCKRRPREYIGRPSAALLAPSHRALASRPRNTDISPTHPIPEELPPTIPHSSYLAVWTTNASGPGRPLSALPVVSSLAWGPPMPWATTSSYGQ